MYDNGGGGLGIGRNSTFLKAVVDSGAAPSTSWGLWTGNRRSENPMSGLLMIGGYDDARVSGDGFHTFDSRDERDACVQIEALSWVSDA